VTGLARCSRLTRRTASCSEPTVYMQPRGMPGHLQIEVSLRPLVQSPGCLVCPFRCSLNRVFMGRGNSDTRLLQRCLSEGGCSWVWTFHRANISRSIPHSLTGYSAR
jgi:hypothetical protein